MRPYKISVILFLIGGTVFCGSPKRDKGTLEEYTPVISEKEGIRTLMNPDFPREGTFDLVLQEELALGEEEEEDRAVLNRPFDVRAASNGDIYVLDWGDIHIKVYDREGRFLYTIGRKGQGPGEFDAPSYFDLAADGSICLLDSRTRRIEIFDAGGDLVKDFRLEGFNSRIRCDGAGGMYFAKETSGEEAEVLNTWQEIPVLTSIFRVGMEGGDPFLVGDFPGKVRRIMRTGEQSSMSVGSFFDVVWLVGRDGRLYAGLNKTYLLGVYSPQGEILFRFGREHHPAANPRAKSGAPDKYMPAFHRYSLMDEEGCLWLNIYDEDEARVTYDVFSPEGIYLKHIISPVRISSFCGGRIYAIVQPEDGYPSVKRYAFTFTKNE